MMKNPRGDPLMRSIDTFTEVLNLSSNKINEIIKNAIIKSEELGEPYTLICKKCNNREFCLLLKIIPIPEEYLIDVLGCIIYLSRNEKITPDIEMIIRFSKIIRTYNERIAFYISPELSGKAVKILCRDHSPDEKITVKALPYEEGIIYDE